MTFFSRFSRRGKRKKRERRRDGLITHLQEEGREREKKTWENAGGARFSKMRKLLLPLLLALWSCCCCLCQHQQVDVDYTDECPEEFGFYADAVQCDRYYECKNGEVSEPSLTVIYRTY